MPDDRIERSPREPETDPTLEFFENLFSYSTPVHNALARREAEAHEGFARALGEMFAHVGPPR